MFVHTSTNLFDLIIRKTKKGYVIHFISICIFSFLSFFFLSFCVFTLHSQDLKDFERHQCTVSRLFEDLTCWKKTNIFIKSTTVRLYRISHLKSENLRTVKELAHTNQLSIDIPPIQLFYVLTS